MTKVQVDEEKLAAAIRRYLIEEADAVPGRDECVALLAGTSGRVVLSPERMAVYVWRYLMIDNAQPIDTTHRA